MRLWVNPWVVIGALITWAGARYFDAGFAAAMEAMEDALEIDLSDIDEEDEEAA